MESEIAVALQEEYLERDHRPAVLEELAHGLGLRRLSEMVNVLEVPSVLSAVQRWWESDRLAAEYIRDLSPIAELQNLESLFLNGTAVSDLSPIAGLQGLRTLDLDGTAVSDLSPLAGLQELTYSSRRTAT